MPLLKTPTGETISLPEEEVGSAVASGYQPVDVGQGGIGTPDKIDTGALGGLFAGGTGLLSGATLGLSDVIGSQFADKGGLDFIKQSREQHPITTGGSEFLGALIPSIAAPGSGLAATPAGATSALGRTIVDSVMPEGVGLLGKTAAHSVGAAAEGALYGGGDYLSQMAIEDKPLTAEGFVGAMGHGALFAAPIGGTFSLGESALIRARKLFPKEQVSAAAAAGIETEAKATLKQAVVDGDALSKAAESKLAEVDAKVGLAQHGEQHTRAAFGGADPQSLADQAVGGVDKVALQDALTEFEASKAQLHDWLQTEGGDLEASLTGMQTPSVQSVEGQSMRRTGAVWPPEASEIGAGEAGFGADQATSAGKRKVPSDLLESRSDGDLESLLRGTKSKLDEGAKLNQLGTENPAYKQIDIGTPARPAGRGPHDNYEKSAMAADERAMQAATKEAPKVGGPDDLMALLGKQEEHTSVLGKRILGHGEPVPVSAAEYVNRQSLGKRILSPEGDDARIAKLLSKKSGKDLGPDLSKAAQAIGGYEASSAKLTDLLGKDAPVTSQMHAKDYQAAVAKGADATGASSSRLAEDIKAKAPQGVIDQAMAQAKTWREFVSSKMSEYMKSEGSHSGAMRRLSDEWKLSKSNISTTASSDSTGLGGIVDTLKALGIAHVATKIPVIGPILGLFLKAKAVMGILGRKGGSIGRTAEGVIASKAAATQDRIVKATTKLLDVGIKATGKAAHLAGPAALLAGKLFPGGANPKGKDLHELYQARMDEISRAQQPGAVAMAISDRIKTSDPHLQDAITAQIQRGIDFLAKKAPRQSILPGMMPGDGKWMPSKAALEEFGKYVHAVNDPASVLEDLAKGHISMEGAEVLRVVYPNLYAQAQRALMEHAADLQKTLPYARRVALSIMYQLPMDSSMSPSHMMFLQPPPTPGGGAGGAGGAPMMATPPMGGVPPMAPAITGPLQIGAHTMTAFDRRAGQ